MEAYRSFARVYDLFMDNVPYEEWSGYLIGLLKGYGIADGLVLDLGCGTGKLTRLLHAAGYDMIGVDGSADMLEIAREAEWDAPEDDGGNVPEDGGEDAPEDGGEDTGQNDGEERRILYLLQDMRELELYGTVRAVVSVCDCINYITDASELLAVFRLVNNYLDPGGIFIFDINTCYKYREVLGETAICENRREGSFIWENYFDEESCINEYDLTLFIQEEGDLYRKYEETHYQRAYGLDEIKRLLAQAGLMFLAAGEAYTGEPVRADSERIYVIAKECRKMCGADTCCGAIRRE